jgi:cobalt-zinc-cadmium resistance protein CzcA
VAAIDTIGGFVKQYHVQPDPRDLAAFGLSFHDLIEALERNNLSTGGGYVEHNGESYIVRAAGRLSHPSELAEIVVGERRGTPIRLRDVARVGIGRELRTGSASEDGEEVVVGTAFMLLGANSRVVSATVDARMADVNRSLPPDVRAKTVLNRMTLVDATIRTVRSNLAEGALLVIVVLFLMLGNFRAALITALAIPLSMLLTAIGMVQTRTSGNLMSLGAIDFGLVVDSSVIMVENSVRRLSEDASDRSTTDVVRDASIEVRKPTMFGELIITIVYLPILPCRVPRGRCSGRWP